MDLGLKDKVALVTAASRGLGKAAALALAREGARVAICSHTPTALEAGEQIRRETGAEVLAVQADLLSPADVSALVAATFERFHQIDILILNSGGPTAGSFLSLQAPDWERAFQLIVMSTVRLCYEVVPHMAQRGSGSIVASQSFSVKQPVENLVLSNALRMAVVGLVKSLASELGPKGIRVNSINPGWTRTERFEDLLVDRSARSGGTPDEEIARISREIPLGRVGTVEEYGRAIAWLASPAASYIHGHALFFDGGAVRAAL